MYQEDSLFVVGQDSWHGQVFPDELVTGGRVHFVKEREHVGQDHACLVVFNLLCNQQINIAQGKFTILLCFSITRHYIFNDVYCIHWIINDDTSVWHFWRSYVQLYGLSMSGDLHLFSDNHQIKISNESFLSISLQ